ncbi:MAG: sigma 54-interacting transcriptional regulator [Cryobacterium sp.]|nr:sigma 54-interacting transcriptional regulator [Oligoflexia bacterium]
MTISATTETKAGSNPSSGRIITNDRQLNEIMNLAKTVAQSKATVLIQGESGTGKELMANLIHQSSNRAGRPFVAINCAAIPENLLESELFGYERGAFTGAVAAKAGKFELANNGTLLLDEISEMDIRLQAKLLRVIQEGEVDRLGGRKPTGVDVRIIATTNRNLSDCVREGSFREDLFYRLNVVNLTIPSLRDRTGDVKTLAESFIKHYAEQNSKPVSGISQEALAILDMHTWPGNVRELENVMERAVITAQGMLIQSKDVVIERRIRTETMNITALGGHVGSDKNPWSPGETLNDIERMVILQALDYHQGNRTHTARALGISIRTLRNKLAEYRVLGIQV